MFHPTRLLALLLVMPALVFDTMMDSLNVVLLFGATVGCFRVRGVRENEGLRSQDQHLQTGSTPVFSLPPAARGISLSPYLVALPSRN